MRLDYWCMAAATSARSRASSAAFHGSKADASAFNVAHSTSGALHIESFELLCGMSAKGTPAKKSLLLTPPP
eukprot:CAMPEP_0115879920 /NCGR_PEP_ID=MMETSP0287-20121206/27588_1 /TAXON_ID=412157 /ORGANISM="Chrysochromulina rotalis, Strain UIO044" /LENGTH=71 /DNA_ID=CAMNT_0003335683 /DNA_START=248 /DNA_END=460 /DNA_ORIENTATION=-